MRRDTSRRRPGETEAERADRDFADLLQELRITLTGGQTLFAVSLAEGVFLVVDYLYSFTAALAFGLGLLAWYLGWFFLVPWSIRRRETRDDR